MRTGEGERTGRYVGGAAAGRKRQAGQARGGHTHTHSHARMRTQLETQREREKRLSEKE